MELTLDMLAKDIAEKALDNYIYDGKTIREWVEILAKQQPRTGQWIDKKMTIKGGHGLAYGRYGCSVCKKKQPSKTNFCPYCGADMREREHKE